MLEKKDLELIAQIVTDACKPIHQRLDRIDVRLDNIDIRLDSVDERFDRMDERLNNMDKRLDRMDERLDLMDKRLDHMDERLDRMDKRLDHMATRLNKLETNVTDIQMTLENETNKNICIIAEGHIDLSRKLDDALKAEAQKEMFFLRVNHLESEVRRLKTKSEVLV